jgi:hypothetical protein
MPTKTKPSNFTAQWDGVCISCGESVTGHLDSGHGEGHRIHWARGSASGGGKMLKHCNKGCCTCGDDARGLSLYPPLSKDRIESYDSGGSKQGGDEGGGGKGQSSEGEGDGQGEGQSQGTQGESEADVSTGGEWEFQAPEPTTTGNSEIDEFLKRLQEKALDEVRGEAQAKAEEMAKAAAEKAKLEATKAKAKAEKAQQEAEAKAQALEQELEKEKARHEIEIKRPDGSTLQLNGHHHRNFDKLVQVVSAGLYPILVGGPGGGKSYAAMQLAEALGNTYRGHVSLHPMSSPAEIFGLIYADGNYRGTASRAAIQEGGITVWEEIFNCSPQMQARVNSTLSSKVGDFPDRQVPFHKDAVIVMTDNTYGYGGDWLFPERRAADAAFRNRLVFIDWPYDEELEMKLALHRCKQAGGWVEWVWQVREFCANTQTRLIVSPRTSMEGATLLENTNFSIEEIAEMSLFKGMDETDIDSIVNVNPLPKRVEPKVKDTFPLADVHAVIEEAEQADPATVAKAAAARAEVEARTRAGGDEAVEREEEDLTEAYNSLYNNR